MKTWAFACAILVAIGTVFPESSYADGTDEAVAAFYARRHGVPLWLTAGPDSPAATLLISVLRRGVLDGLPAGGALADRVEALLDEARSGDAAALTEADELLSTSWISYVDALQMPIAGVAYADYWVRPQLASAEQILLRAAGSANLPDYVRTASTLNPVYDDLRDSEWAEMRATAGPPDPRVLTSLGRVRAAPALHRYIIIDAASARLYMIEDGRIVDTMKVVVGKSEQSTQTPMMASTIYYATLRPYWHVPPELVQSLIARNVLSQGPTYLKSHGYEVMPSDSADDSPVDSLTVDWKAVAAGTEIVRVRQLPGPSNSMGRVKFGFRNDWNIFLHDTPNKATFAHDDRSLSHGCIRLEDAERLGKWMMGSALRYTGTAAEQQVPLPAPVPVYVTYLTAIVNDGKIQFVKDPYGKETAYTGR